MRSYDKKIDPVIDPVSGSELKFEMLEHGRDPGNWFDFRYRENPGAAALDFKIKLCEQTGVAARRYRKIQGLPELNDFLESIAYTREYAEIHGRDFSVWEMYLCQDGPLSKKKSISRAFVFDIDWSKLNETGASSLLDALARLIFFARSRQADGVGFYPDQLEISPYGMPAKLIKRKRPTDYFGL